MTVIIKKLNNLTSSKLPNQTKGFTKVDSQLYAVQSADSNLTALTLYTGILDDCLRHCHYNKYHIISIDE